MKIGKKVEIWAMFQHEILTLEGEILATRRGHHLRISFTHPYHGHQILWFRSKSTVHYRRQGTLLGTRCYFYKNYAYFQAKLPNALDVFMTR